MMTLISWYDNFMDCLDWGSCNIAKRSGYLIKNKPLTIIADSESILMLPGTRGFVTIPCI